MTSIAPSRSRVFFLGRLPASSTRLSICFLGFALAAFMAGCATEPVPPPKLKVGNVLPKMTLHDQNEKPHQIDETVRVIFFTRDMESGKVVQQLLAAEGEAFLQKYRVIYITDISDMPSLIATMIAIPKMQEERAYPTLLDRDGTATAAFPSEEGRVTILLLQELKIVGIEYRGSAGGLRDAAKMRLGRR